MLGYTNTKTAGMLSIESLRNPGFNTFSLGVIDHHADPSSGLQNRIMPPHQMNQGQRTEKSSKLGFHSVYSDDFDRGFPSMQSK
jgi:hypothetical protein